MSIPSDIIACLDKPRTLLELVEAMAGRAGLSLTNRCRDGDLGAYADDMQRRGYTPSNVLSTLRSMKGVVCRPAERLSVGGGTGHGRAHWRYVRHGDQQFRVLDVQEWVLV